MENSRSANQTYCPECYSWLKDEDWDDPQTLNDIQIICKKCVKKISS